MPSSINHQELFEWCRIPPEDLENHPQARFKLKIVPTKDDVYRWAAQEMLDEVRQNNAAGHPTRWILPCGPKGQYPYFIQWVNEQRLSLKNTHIFHMDDSLDWQARPLPLDHLFSYEGWMRRNFYDPIDPDLNVPESQRHFPTVYDLDGLSRAIEAAGGVDTMFGGVGYRGHIAFNEAPRSPWYTVTREEFASSKTRILHLNEDTLIALSQRAAGGCSHAIPPMAITIGMQDLLSARRVRLLSETGAWKQTMVRVLLFSQPTVEYPVTLLQGHPDAILVVDQDTAASPPI
jgi:glucosamine-6-phosphate deaminase